MNILLIGGNGYIGSKFYHLYKNEHTITSIDLCLFHSNLGYSTEINYNEIDIDQYDVIVCLAGHSSVPMCEYSPKNSWQNNVTYFHNLCSKITNQKLIYASSASVYGKTVGISTESSDINFNVINHYDLQKITIDLIANKYINEGKNIIGLRFGTVNGASINARSDLMINSMVKSAIETNQVHAKNLHIRRAILGINDACRAIAKIATTNINPGQYNLASFNSTVGDIANTVCNILGAELVTHPDDLFVYDFELDTSQFTNSTGFLFTDTIPSLIEELKTNYNGINFETRTHDKRFTI